MRAWGVVVGLRWWCMRISIHIRFGFGVAMAAAAEPRALSVLSAILENCNLNLVENGN